MLPLGGLEAAVAAVKSGHGTTLHDFVSIFGQK
jgi:hypothetical protein